MAIGLHSTLCLRPHTFVSIEKWYVTNRVIIKCILHVNCKYSIIIPNVSISRMKHCLKHNITFQNRFVLWKGNNFPYLQPTYPL